MNSLGRTLLALVTLTSLAFSAGDDTSRLHALTRKAFCRCGCGEVLAECSHPQCPTKGSMKQEIASAVESGKTDDDILAHLENKYGADILVVPGFHGFNVFLWIVPLAVTLIASAIFVWRRW